MTAAPPTTTTTTDSTTDTVPESTAGGMRGVLHSVRSDLARQLSDPTPAYAALGATEAVALRVRDAVRHGAALAGRVRRTDGEVDATHLPRLAVSQAITLAGRAEAAYTDMATRGRDVAERVRDGRQASELLRLAVLGVTRVMPSSGRGSEGEAPATGGTVEVTRAPAATPKPAPVPDTSAADVTDAAGATATVVTDEAATGRAASEKAAATGKATSEKAAATGKAATTAPKAATAGKAATNGKAATTGKAASGKAATRKAASGKAATDTEGSTPSEATP